MEVQAVDGGVFDSSRVIATNHRLGGHHHDIDDLTAQNTAINTSRVHTSAAIREGTPSVRVLGE